MVGSLLPEGIGGGAVNEPEGVEVAETDAFRTVNGCLRRKINIKRNDEGVFAFTSTDSSNKSDDVGSGLVVGGIAVVAVGRESIAEIPMGCFCCLVEGHGVDAVGTDGALVDELDIDVTVGVGDNSVEPCQGIAGTTEGAKGELA